MARKLDEEKRARIIDAAGEAFGSDGYQKTTIKQIALATGIAQGTVYTYFRSKEDLFDAVAEGIWRSFTDGLDAITLKSASHAQKFVEFLDFGFGLLVRIHPLLRGMYAEANRRELLQEKVEAICTYLDGLFVAPDGRPMLFADISDDSRNFNLNVMVSGVLFRTSLTKPSQLGEEIEFLKRGILKSLGERLAIGGTA